MKYCFVDVLNFFLFIEGCQDLINLQFDCYLIIQLELNELLFINVDLLIDDIILWCSIVEC